MKWTFKLLVPLFALLLSLHAGPATPPAAGPEAPGMRGPGPGEGWLELLPGARAFAPPPSANAMTAHALRRAARRDAVAGFWVRIANAINHPAVPFSQQLQDAQADLADALAHAQDQFDARMGLAPLFGNGSYDPQVTPQEFTSQITNSLFPLVPGRTLIYEKATPDGLEQLVVTVEALPVTIGGFACRVLRETETLDEALQEETTNWFAQKNDGSVWYFGEIARHYEDGILDNLDGSWRMGKDDA